MRQAILLFATATSLLACNSSDQQRAKSDTQPADTKVAGASDTAKIDYAYTIEHPDQWEWGNREHTKIVLESLKAYEQGDLENATKNFADTVDLLFDNYELRATRDSVRKVFAEQWKHMKSMKIDMDDFESVRSKDGKQEYVSLWYKQKWQDMKGAWDSVSVMDDLRIRNGKIASIDEKVRHYPKKKM
jgi:hypothetical protein